MSKSKLLHKDYFIPFFAYSCLSQSETDVIKLGRYDITLVNNSLTDTIKDNHFLFLGFFIRNPSKCLFLQKSKTTHSIIVSLLSMVWIAGSWPWSAADTACNAHHLPSSKQPSQLYGPHSSSPWPQQSRPGPALTPLSELAESGDKRQHWPHSLPR